MAETSYQRYVAQLGRPQTPLARKALIERTIRQEAATNPAQLARALNLPTTPGSSFLDTAGKAVSAASLALAPAEIAAELALGTNPVTALPLIAFDIASLTGLIPSFAGRPKMLDTIQAIQRLAQSRQPAIQQLAANLAIYARNGVPLSTSNPAEQAQLRGWIGGAVSTLLAQNGLAATGQNVALLDQAIRNVITSEVANPGSRIDATIGSLGGRLAAPAPAAPQGLSIRSIRSTRPGATLPAPLAAPAAMPAMQPGMQSSSLPAQADGFVKRLFHQLGSVSHDAVLLTEVTACLASAYATQNPALAEECLTAIGAQFALQQGAEEIRRLLTSIGQAARNQINNLLGRQPAPTPSQPAPILDQVSDCPSCSPQGRQLARQLGQQEQRVLRDIQREQEQLTEQELGQQAEQLTQLEQQETQPAGQRDIGKELQRKQQLLENIQQEQRQLGTQPGAQPQITQPGAQPGQPAPTLQPSSSEVAQREIEQELHDQSEAQSVQFCVGCKSHEDAILFLNGEPSQCSVIPGSTKEISYG